MRSITASGASTKSTLESTHLFNECASATVYHENIRGRPRSHLARAVVFTLGISSSSVDIGIAQVRICVVDILSNGSTVRRHTEKCFTMVVSRLFEQTVGNLYYKIEKESEGVVLFDTTDDWIAFPW